MNIVKAHQLLGHKNEGTTRRTAKALGIQITRGSLPACEACAVSKAKQKNVSKKSKQGRVTIPLYMVHTDISTIKVHDGVGDAVSLSKSNWIIRVDSATGKKWSAFVPAKSGFVENTVEWLTQLKTRGHPLQILRMDPSGENKKLETRLQQVDCAHLQPIDCQFTPRDSPQYNSAAETAFPYVAGLARALMHAAGIPRDFRAKLAIEAIKCATLLDGLTVVTIDNVTATRDTHVYGDDPGWSTALRTWGEAGVVKEGKDGKTGDRGVTVVFVGYPGNRTNDCYRFWNPSTNRVIESRDVIWLGQMYFKKQDRAIMTSTNSEEDCVDPSDLVAMDEQSDSDDDTQSEKTITFADNDDTDELAEGSADDPATSGRSTQGTVAASSTQVGILRGVARTSRPPRHLADYEVNLANRIRNMDGNATELNYLAQMLELDNGELALCEISLVGAGVGGGFNHTDELRTLTYKQAMASLEADEWKEAVQEEAMKFKKFKVFKVIKKADLPVGSTILSTTWVFKKKTNGSRRGRLNARGFEQIEGKHYFNDSISSPVSNPPTIRIMLVMTASNPRWTVRVIDVEGAFLQGQFGNGEVMYAEVPDGMEEHYGSRDDVVLQMLVPLYGTKQAAECFYRRFVNKSKEKGYERSNADFCLYYVWRHGRLLIFATWVDDIVVCGEEQDIKAFEADIKQAFEAKSEPVFNEYVGNHITINRGDDGIAAVKFTQPVLIQKLSDNFTPISSRVPKTPALPGSNLCKGDDTGTLTGDQATRYRSLTATCMYMMQWSRPDIYQATRALARCICTIQTSHMTRP